MRYLGLDVHRDFCEVAICERGRARSAGRIDTTREALELFASSLAPDDRVVLESTGNALAIANILRGRVAEVVLANPMQVRAISHAKVKNDRVDARTLAELLAADLLPQVWIADDSTRALRRLTSRRTQLVRQRTRTKNEVSAVLIRNLIARPKVSDLFGRAGRQFMATLVLPADERHTLDGCLRQVDFLGEELAVIDRRAGARLRRHAPADHDPRRRRHHRRDDDGHDRAHPALPDTAPAGRLRRSGRPRPPIRKQPRPARADLQARHLRRPSRARSGRLGRDQDARAAARLLPAHQGPPRRPDRDRRRRPQAHDPRLAPAHQATGLPPPTPAARRPQAPPARAPSRRPTTPRPPPLAPAHRFTGPATRAPRRSSLRGSHQQLADATAPGGWGSVRSSV
jgi:hypothetical protein